MMRFPLMRIVGTAMVLGLITLALLFVSGVRDGFGSVEEMTAALKLIPARTELLPITGAGHELMTKRNRDEVTQSVVGAFRAFASH